MLVKLHTIFNTRIQTGVKTKEEDIDPKKLTGDAKKAVDIFYLEGIEVNEVSLYKNRKLHCIVTPNKKEDFPKHWQIKLKLESQGLGHVERIYKGLVIEWRFY